MKVLHIGLPIVLALVGGGLAAVLTTDKKKRVQNGLIAGIAILCVAGLGSGVLYALTHRTPATAPAFDPSGCSEFSPKTGYALDPDVSRAAGECSWPEPSTPTPTVTPTLTKALTQTPTPTSVPPTATPELAALAGGAPSAATSKHIVAGKNVPVTLVRGFWHFNVACAGCAQGIEDNYVVRYNLDVPTPVVLPEGSVWWYSLDFDQAELYRLTHNDPRDRWPNVLPAWLDVSGVTALTLVAPTSMPTAVVPVAPAVPPVELRKIQGEDKTYTLQAGKVYYASFWWRGDEREYHYVFELKENVTVSFNGTLIEYSTMPRRINVTNPDNKHIWPENLDKLPELKGKVTMHPLSSLP